MVTTHKWPDYDEDNIPFERLENVSESKFFRNATNLVSKHAKFNVDFENNWLLGKHPCRTRNCAFGLPDSPEMAPFFCNQTRIGIIPTRKADPNIFSIALKQDYIDAQYVKLPYSM